jgi:hypothetical protein
LVVELTAIIGLECANDSSVARLNFRGGVWRQVEQCCVLQLNVELLQIGVFDVRTAIVEEQYHLPSIHAPIKSR